MIKRGPTKGQPFRQTPGDISINIDRPHSVKQHVLPKPKKKKKVKKSVEVNLELEEEMERRLEEQRRSKITLFYIFRGGTREVPSRTIRQDVLRRENQVSLGERVISTKSQGLGETVVEVKVGSGGGYPMVRLCEVPHQGRS